MERAAETRVVEECTRRAQPAVEMDDLVVGEDVLVHGDVTDPSMYHALHNPGGGGKQHNDIINNKG